jgi:hypothetical protein
VVPVANLRGRSISENSAPRRCVVPLGVVSDGDGRRERHLAPPGVVRDEGYIKVVDMTNEKQLSPSNRLIPLHNRRHKQLTSTSPLSCFAYIALS